MSIVEKLYYGRPLAAASGGLPTVLPTTWHGKLTQSTPKLHNSRFVVDDDHVLDQLDRGALDTENLPASTWRLQQRPPTHERTNWTMIYEYAYTKINKPAANATVDFSDILGAVKEAYDNGGDSLVFGVRTWYVKRLACPHRKLHD